MYLERLSLRDFRCFTHVDIRPQPGVNIIFGGNATGKTSLLEAIYLCGRGQSFRPSRPAELVHQGAVPGQFVAHGKFVSDRNIIHRVGITNEGSGLRYELNGSAQTNRFDLVNTIPVQLVEPNLHRLFEMGPKYRRRFLDWGVFHVEQQFFPAWRQYRRVLKQRNNALRKRLSLQTVTAWDHQLERNALIVDACRRRYIQLVKEYLPKLISTVMGNQTITISYDPGWKSNTSFSDSLSQSLERDVQRGFTQHGPHRADFRVDVSGVRAKDHVSRGQQKILISSLLLAQVKILQQCVGVTPIILIDDLAAELDSSLQEVLIGEVMSLRCQTFITYLDKANLPTLSGDCSMFHVEHGDVNKL